MGRGRDFRGGGKGRRPYEEEVVPVPASDPRPFRQFRDSFPSEGSAVLPPRNIAPAAPAAATPDLPPGVDVLGTVKWFTPEKGMGFVEADGGGKDVFLHISVVKRAQLTSLAEGQRVAMRVVETHKGRQAVSVALAN